MAGDTLERLYAALLRLYPAAYRAEYGAPMRLHFRDQLRDARQAGGGAVIGLLLRALWDVLRTVPAQRRLHGPVGPRDAAGWGRVVAAVVPGVLLILATVFIRSESTTLYPALLAFVSLTGLYLGAGWLLEGRLAVSMLPLIGFAAGYLALAGMLLAGDVSGRIPVPVGWVPLAVFGGAGLLAVLRALARVWSRSRGRAAVALVLFVGLLALAGAEWAGRPVRELPLGIWFGSWIPFAFVGLGVPFARRFGDRAVLATVGALGWVALIFLDTVDRQWGLPWVTLYPLLVWASTLLLVPLLVLRLRRPLVRTAVVLLPLGSLFALGVVLERASWGDVAAVRTFFDAFRLIGWLAFALVLYGGLRREEVPAVASQQAAEAAG